MFARFEGIRDAVSLHMVEVSPKLSEMQQEKLSGVPTSQTNNSDATDSPDGHPSRLGQSDEESSLDKKCYRCCRSKHGPPVSWYRRLQDVPRGFSFYLAHEFFDALPVHKFQVRAIHDICINISSIFLVFKILIYNFYCNLLFILLVFYDNFYF